MAQQAVPLIRREDYPAIKRISDHDIPDTFETWDYEIFEKREYIRSIGHVPIDIEIDPQEFASHRLTMTEISLREAIIAFAGYKLARKR